MSDERPETSAPGSVMRLLASLATGTNANKVEWEQISRNKYRFIGGNGYVTIDTEPNEEAPFVFTIYDADDAMLEAYEGPTRFSDGRLDERLAGLWRAIIRQKRGRTIEPVIESLIEAAGGEAPAADPLPGGFDEGELDDLPF
jgi:hypothetical protein